MIVQYACDLIYKNQRGTFVRNVARKDHAIEIIELGKKLQRGRDACYKNASIGI